MNHMYNTDVLRHSKVCLLLSGGVDSAVSLHLLYSEGIHPDCYYIKIGPEEQEGYNCNSDEDIEMCQWLTRKYNCLFQIIDCHKDYWDNVTKYTMDCVKRGLTPNPDVMCNKLIKFGVFEERIGYMYDFIATGHYAQTLLIRKVTTDKPVHSSVFLYSAPDPVKDQTDFLCQLSSSILKKAIFPIGHLLKSQVREIAEKENLINKKRKDSQGICFLGKINYNDYVRKFLGEKTGNFVEYETNQIKGTHNGYWFHTIGQRRGITLSGGPWYVVAKDVQTNTVYISHNKNIVLENTYADTNFITIKLDNDSINTFSDKGIVTPMSITSNFVDSNLNDGINILFKIRHTPTLTRGILCYNDGNYYIKVDKYFLNELDGIAPGQYCVIYKDPIIFLNAGNPIHQCIMSGAISM